MNPWKCFATILLCVVCVLTGYSDGFSQLTPANSDDVIAIANNWLRLGQEVEWGWTAAADFTPASIQEIDYQGQLVAYALPVIGGGYIITPAFQELPPITAYSTVSSFDISRENGFCEMIKEVLSDKILLVSEYLTNPNPPAEWQALQGAIEHHRALWQAYAADYGTFTKTVRDENFRSRIDSENQTENPYGIMSVDPLLTCSWHQGDPYNQLCPMGDGGRCVVGCVATATAQIMKYWEYPPNGTGSYSYWWDGDQSCGGSTPGEYLSVTLSDPYDWENILDHYDGGETQAQEDAVAELCYEVGVAEDMMYGVCGSGTYMSNAMDAFTIHFGYSDQIDYQYRTSYGSPEAWFDMLAEELNQLRPMQYHISRHSIVCDGWRVSGTNQVHMNYGWDSSHNTWYTVDELYCPWEGCSPWVEGTICRIFPNFELLSPNGGEVWCNGEGYDITWDGSGIEASVTISLNRDYPSGAWEVLFSGTENDGVEWWDVDEPVTQNARIRIIRDDSPSIGDTSSGDFAISGFYMSLVYPNGGETWYINQPYGISWAFCDTGNVDISLNRNFPSGEWEALFTNSPGDGFEEWTVTGPFSNNARIRVISVSDPQLRDSSENDFIIDPRHITVLEPNGGETWYVGFEDTIRWINEGVSGTVRIQIDRNYPGGQWEDIAINTENDGIYLWEVTGVATTQARIRVTSDDYTYIFDISNDNLTISDQVDIAVTSPNGGEIWYADSTMDITWTCGSFASSVLIELDRAYPSSWETLYVSTDNDGIESWTVTGPVSDQARVQITSISEPSVSDISDADFSIIEDNPPVIWHDPIDDGTPDSALFVAMVYDEFLVPTVRLFYRTLGAGVYDSTDMISTGNPDEFAATLYLTGVGSYEYYIKAVDVSFQTSVTDVYDFQLYPICGTTISYDNGSADRFNWAGVEEFRWAVRFTPAATPFVLCGARVGISPDKPDAAHTHFYVEVYDESGGVPGTLLFSDTTGSIGNVIGGLPTGQTHWADVVLRDTSGEPLELWGDFFIAIGNPNTLLYEAFARDTTGTNSDRSFLYDGCTETWYNENDAWENCKVGNRLIRALGYAQNPPEVVVYRAGDDAELHWSNTGAPFYRIYSDTTPFGAYATLEGSASDTLFVDINAASSSDKKFYRVMSSTLP